MTNKHWKPAAASRKYGVAICSFQCDQPHVLPLEIGETVQITEEYGTKDDDAIWFRGCSFSNKDRKGIFPCSHVHIKPCTVENEGFYEVVNPVEDPIIKELTYVLREWHTRWKNMFINQDMNMSGPIATFIQQLHKNRRILVSDTLTKEQAEELKRDIVNIIDWGNGKLDMDLVPRQHYRQVDPEQVSIIEMCRIHQKSYDNRKDAWTEEGPSGEVTVKSRKVQSEVVHHLLIGVRSFSCTIGEKAEISMFLYDNSSNSCLSEKYVTYFREGKKIGDEEKGFSETLFTDLSTEDTKKDIYLVIHILRRGRLTPDGNTKKQALSQYRRPWGISVIPLKEIINFKNESELDYFVRVQTVDNDNQFYCQHEYLIKKNIVLTGRGAGTEKQLQSMTITIKMYSGDATDHPTLFGKTGPVITPRMGFSDFVKPGEVRNDLYLTLVGVELDKGNKSASKNVEARVTVFNHSYVPIVECICSANGNSVSSNFYSYVVYHNNSPRWNEILRLSIPTDNFSYSHVRIDLYHCSNQNKIEKKLYGFAYLCVTNNDGATRSDDSYNLALYKCDEVGKVKNYLNMPSLADDFNDPSSSSIPPLKFVRSNKEHVIVETFLCSSKFAQRKELLDVLQWDVKPPKMLPSFLEALVKVKAQELIRYLRDVLDALFNMFNGSDLDGNMVPYAMNIFQCLVHVFNLIKENQFDKFSCVLEDYLEKSFSSVIAHRDMLMCLKEKVDQIYMCSDFDEKNPTKRVFEVLDDIFKFAVKSTLLCNQLYKDPRNQHYTTFKGNLKIVFEGFAKVLKSEEHVLVETQCQLLNNLHKTFTPLFHIISMPELSKFVVYILNSIPRDRGPNVMGAKTVLIKNTVNSPLMMDKESQKLLLPLTISHLKKCLIQKHNLALTANTMGDLLTIIFDLKERMDMKEEVASLIKGLLDVTLGLILTLNDSQKEEVGSVLTSCLLEMLRLMDKTHYKVLMSDYPKPNLLRTHGAFQVVLHTPTSSSPAKDFLSRIIIVFSDLIKMENFPKDWTTMRMITNYTMLTSIQYIAEELSINFLHGSNYDKGLWKKFFQMAVHFITQPALQLEKYSEAKSVQIKDRYEDMRLPVGHHVYSLWNELGEHKNGLVMDMIRPFLKVTMVPEERLRKATIPIFFDIMKCEWQKTKDLKRIEGKISQDLDFLVIDHHGDADYKQLFMSILLDKVQTEPEMEEEGKRFVYSITELLERLLDYREIMNREEQRDTKMHCTFNILNFYKGNREDMYIRYISRLYELHYKADNFVEAGLTLRLYAQLLPWSSRPMSADMNYDAQTEGQRKEMLMTRILDCFDKGKAWEYGLPLCKELGEQYEKTFQYGKLGEILKKHAFFLQQILEGVTLRQPPAYYRVAYYGSTFPPYLKNKAFIYRGDECLKLVTILSQLKTEYPAAKVLTSNMPVEESIKQGDMQYIQIVAVKPVPVPRPEFNGKEVPQEISSFYEFNEIDTFQFDRPFHRNGKDKANEHRSLCLERSTVKTMYPLPGILRWYEVVDSQVTVLTPVQKATDSMKLMIVELETNMQKTRMRPQENIRQLEMRLQGVISGAVNGGIPMYHEAFFNDDYKSKFPEEVEQIKELRMYIKSLIVSLEEALSIHKQHAKPEMIPLHHSLVEQLNKMKTELDYQTTQPHFKPRESETSMMSTARSSTPNSTASLPSTESGSNRSSGISQEAPAFEIEEVNVYQEVDTGFGIGYDTPNDSVESRSSDNVYTTPPGAVTTPIPQVSVPKDPPPPVRPPRVPIPSKVPQPPPSTQPKPQTQPPPQIPPRKTSPNPLARNSYAHPPSIPRLPFLSQFGGSSRNMNQISTPENSAPASMFFVTPGKVPGTPPKPPTKPDLSKLDPSPVPRSPMSLTSPASTSDSITSPPALPIRRSPSTSSSGASQTDYTPPPPPPVPRRKPSVSPNSPS